MPEVNIVKLKISLLSEFICMATKPLSFSQAIQATQSLMDRINSEELDEAEIEQMVSAIVDSKNGGRGFFVAYLTSNMPLADNPSKGIVNGLKSSTEIVSELLVKNLAMSSAMAITHKRNNDLDNLQGSQKVHRRTKDLIKQIELDLVEEELKKLQSTISTGQGDYQNFLERWNYDMEQQQAIQKAIVNALS